MIEGIFNQKQTWQAISQTASQIQDSEGLLRKLEFPLPLTIPDCYDDKLTVDDEMIRILIEMGKQTNDQLEKNKLMHLEKKLKKNDVDINLEPDGKRTQRVKDHIYDYWGFHYIYH